MGNPAMDRRRRSEKRRKRYEQRLGPGVYLPKAERERFNAEYAQAQEAIRAERAKRAAERKARKLEKERQKRAAAAPAAPPPKA